MREKTNLIKRGRSASIKLNSGTYRGTVLGVFYEKSGEWYRVRLLGHPHLKEVSVRKHQIIEE